MSLFQSAVRKHQGGSVLILTLWALLFLSTLASILGMRIRSDIALLSRVEKRGRLALMATSGVRKAMVLVSHDVDLNSGYTVQGKMLRHNNENTFKNIRLQQGESCEVNYAQPETPSPEPRLFYGMADEERKINLNKTDLNTLVSLFQGSFGWDTEKARKLAAAIIDWRIFGESELKGFYSEDYYENLEYPYPPKKADFENMDELLLVEGIDGGLLRLLSSIVTVYGDGKININTASYPVLVASGFSDFLAGNIIALRRGPDGMEATGDDFIFLNAGDLASQLKEFAKIKPEEEAAINEIVARGKIGTNSSYYRIRSEAALDNNRMHGVITCIFNAKNRQIESWKERYEVSD